MSHSRDYDELLHVWTAWRDAVGPPIRSKYIRYVQLANHAARLNGKQLFFINVRIFLLIGFYLNANWIKEQWQVPLTIHSKTAKLQD
jgi:hypothetical protein